jgi:hypothetical protein
VGAGHVGLYLEGPAPTCYKSSLGAIRKNITGQGELAGTFVLTVKTQLLEIVYFWKFDTKFGF